ncbi:MAG TPA: response regulator transcription factor [Erysipelotrichaceae bacterium]|nr:response regulator transcription factor [Erysipelotrichaceae bacterium]
MFKVAILDDDNTALMIFTSAVEVYLKEKNIEHQLFAFSNPFNFLASAKEEWFQLVFLDVDMPEMNGLEVCRELSNINKNTQVIFLSQREDLIFECLALHPFGFIRKSKLIDDFDSMMNQYYSTYLDGRYDTSTIEFVDKNKTMSFKIREIVYIKSDRNYQKIVLSDKSNHLVRIPLNVLEEKLKERGFIRIHKGYLLNYLYVRSISSEKVELTNGTSLPLSKRRKEDILKQYSAISRKNNPIIV